MPRPETLARILVALTAVAVVGTMVYKKIERRGTPVVLVIIVPEAAGSTMVAAAKVAAEEVTRQGGFRGRPFAIEAIETGGNVSEATTAAENALKDERVIAVLVAGELGERRAVAGVAERGDMAAFTLSPVLGLEYAATQISLAGMPNQRIAPAAAWALDAFGSRVLLVANDAPLQRIANEIVANQVTRRGGTVIGPVWVGRDGLTIAQAAARAIELVKTEKPNLIISGVAPNQTKPFVQALRSGGVTSTLLPTLHMVLSESDLVGLEPAAIAGDYVIGATFSTLPGAERREFVQAVANAGGSGPVDEAADAAYVAVRLTALATQRRDGLDRAGIATVLRGTRVAGPSGTVQIDPTTSAAWMTCRVGRIDERGVVHEVWHEDVLRRPRAWPMDHSRVRWLELAEQSAAEGSHQ